MAIGSLTAAGVTGRVQSSIARASEKTGVDFSYLLGQAQVESSLRPNARATTSSATGLYQFIDQSWLAVVKKHGEENGLSWAADSIGQGSNGRYYVTDDATRAAILNLRTDSDTASLMAAEHAAENKATLEAKLGREVGGTDLYMAHFLGLAGAKKFLGGLAANPDASGAALFPAAAAANRSVFYTASGQPRSLSSIYQRFADRIEKGTQIALGGNDLPRAASGVPRLPVELAALTEPPCQSDPSTLDRLIAGNDQSSLLRPTPQTARLAYLLLASLGG